MVLYRFCELNVTLESAAVERIDCITAAGDTHRLTRFDNKATAKRSYNWMLGMQGLTHIEVAAVVGIDALA